MLHSVELPDDYGKLERTWKEAVVAHLKYLLGQREKKSVTYLKNKCQLPDLDSKLGLQNTSGNIV
jgi:hypothetical protein